MGRRRARLISELRPEYLQRLELFPEGLLDLTDIVRAREQAHERMDAVAASADLPTHVVAHDELVARPAQQPDVPLRIYIPERRATPSGALLFIHGGGFVMGRASHFDSHCWEIAHDAECLVASVDYRLAPENPYPGPLEDCYAALAFIVANSGRLGIDPRRVAVGGGSAGAGLAAGLALLARDRGGPAIAFQSLEAPMLDHRGITESSRTVVHPKVWSRRSNELAWKAYLGTLEPGSVPFYASPVLAHDLVGLPAAYLAVSALEIFLDETLDYARRLVAAGVPVELHVYPNGFHGSSWAIPDLRLSRRWRRDAIGALREGLSDRRGRDGAVASDEAADE
jgi:acetyl esterase